MLRINCMYNSRMYNSRGVHTPRNRRNVEYAYITCERSPVQSSHIQVMYDVFAYALQTAYRICIFARAISSYITRIFFFTPFCVKPLTGDARSLAMQSTNIHVLLSATCLMNYFHQHSTFE